MTQDPLFRLHQFELWTTPRSIEQSNTLCLCAHTIYSTYKYVTLKHFHFSILDFNKTLLESIYDRITEWSDEQTLGDIFLENVRSFLKFSHTIILHQSFWKTWLAWFKLYEMCHKVNPCIKTNYTDWTITKFVAIFQTSVSIFNL